MIKLQKYDGAFEPTIIDYIIAFFYSPFLKCSHKLSYTEFFDNIIHIFIASARKANKN